MSRNERPATEVSDHKSLKRSSLALLAVGAAALGPAAPATAAGKEHRGRNASPAQFQRAIGQLASRLYSYRHRGGLWHTSSQQETNGLDLQTWVAALPLNSGGLYRGAYYFRAFYNEINGKPVPDQPSYFDLSQGRFNKKGQFAANTEIVAEQVPDAHGHMAWVIGERAIPRHGPIHPDPLKPVANEGGEARHTRPRELIITENVLADWQAEGNQMLTNAQDGLPTRPLLQVIPWGGHHENPF